MATPNEHFDWAEANERFAASVDRSDPVAAGWAITALFYAALHYVDSCFASRGVARGLTHYQRDGKIQDDADLRTIWPDYRRLKDMSREARYQLAQYGEPDYSKALKLLEKVRSRALVYRRRKEL